MSKRKTSRKLELSFEPLETPADINNPDSQSLLVQLMLQVAKIGLRVDENGIDSSIISKENENGKEKN